MNLKDIAIDSLTRALPMENGKADCEAGIGHYEGWRDVATKCGYDSQRRTPAQEAYLDGYYSGKFGSKKNGR